jgi:hypothetical protein
MTDRVEHFSDEAWLELASCLADPARAKEMEAHLATGCGDCTQAYRTWSLILSAAARQPEYEPPQDVVRSVKFAFGAAHNLHSWSKMAVLARLVFDSFLEPQPIGVRGTLIRSRHLFHDGGDFVIDLRLEKEIPGRVFLIGQVLPKDASSRETAGASVVVSDKQEQLLAQAIANSVGEFQLEYADTKDLMVYIAIPDVSVIAIALPDQSENIASASFV